MLILTYSIPLTRGGSNRLKRWYSVSQYELIFIVIKDRFYAVTESLIRKRAEHNEGELSTLEEVSLHQQDIEKYDFSHVVI
jgi:hypothetical protein